MLRLSLERHPSILPISSTFPRKDFFRFIIDVSRRGTRTSTTETSLRNGIRAVLNQHTRTAHEAAGRPQPRPVLKRVDDHTPSRIGEWARGRVGVLDHGDVDGVIACFFTGELGADVEFVVR